MQELRDPDIFETMRKLFLALVLAAPLAAQAWPAKPIRWVVPYTGGGITDVVTRVVTQKMQTSLGQPIVVDNRPGANSILGADIVAKAPPDGYTTLTVIAAHAANATLYSGKLPLTTELLKQTAGIDMVHVPYK